MEAIFWKSHCGILTSSFSWIFCHVPRVLERMRDLRWTSSPTFLRVSSFPVSAEITVIQWWPKWAECVRTVNRFRIKLELVRGRCLSSAIRTIRCFGSMSFPDLALSAAAIKSNSMANKSGRPHSLFIESSSYTVPTGVTDKRTRDRALGDRFLITSNSILEHLQLRWWYLRGMGLDFNSNRDKISSFLGVPSRTQSSSFGSKFRKWLGSIAYLIHCSLLGELYWICEECGSSLWVDISMQK